PIVSNKIRPNLVNIVFNLSKHRNAPMGIRQSDGSTRRGVSKCGAARCPRWYLETCRTRGPDQLPAPHWRGGCGSPSLPLPSASCCCFGAQSPQEWQADASTRGDE